jgi:FAD/FMN-containing dehydrogenase/Fe-S oxidoreductase
MKVIKIKLEEARDNTAETAFLEALRVAGLEGEIDVSYATRTVLATDNSIYQRRPTAAIFPRNVADVERIARLLAEERFRSVVVSPRGGGTGTNGQSLTNGIVVDLSRHMNRIIDIDPIKRTARVQAGVVKDQLNAALKPHGLFFAPELSTSNRATIGGMISTDASGQGSCTYGKTRDHVIALKSVLLGGVPLVTAPVDDAALDRFCARTDIVGRAYRTAREISDSQAELIRDTFPPLNRCLTGYDLAHLREHDGRLNLNSLICGAEGTLGFVVEATLNVLPIPLHSALVNVQYEGFMDALRDARALMEQQPLSIETVDSTVLALARDDVVWASISEFFPDYDEERSAQGINLIEFSADDPVQLQTRVGEFVEHIGTDQSVRRLGHTIAWGDVAVNRVYAMRKRAVGLLGNVRERRRPQPFVEDTAVPPAQLPEYIAEFRALLDSYGLKYGMFGHVDAGVLHVRPALDLRDPGDAALIRRISDAVSALTMKYGGLLWGEHGKGVRSEYAPTFFGRLYPSLQRIKAAFDPYNQLNPGKIAVPAGVNSTLLKIDSVTFSGELNREISEAVWEANSDAVQCNGNGACFNFDPDDSMCPSWKATRQRIHSPKGRASLMREWLRLQVVAGADLIARPRAKRLPVRLINSLRRGRNKDDFSHEVYEAMSGCLACKSCVAQCPVKVNVPEFRSRFLEHYHTRYLRPVRDYMIASLEYTIPRLVSVPGGRQLYNRVVENRLARLVLKHIVGVVDTPVIAQSEARKSNRCAIATPEILMRMDVSERKRCVVVVRDTFTRFFSGDVETAFVELAESLGFRVFFAPFHPNGKPFHVLGFLARFAQAARKNAQTLIDIANTGVTLVGVDPAMTLTYRQEYSKVLGSENVPNVLLPQEWLATAVSSLQTPKAVRESFRLLAHCTEKTNAAQATALWKVVFAAAGLDLVMPSTGCCGMSGTYGHEARNVATSRDIFALSWAHQISESAHPLGNKESVEVLATGYSCRCQVKRLRGKTLRHPVQVLADIYRR